LSGTRHDRAVKATAAIVIKSPLLVTVNNTGLTKRTAKVDRQDASAIRNANSKNRLGRASAEPLYKDKAWTVIPRTIKPVIKNTISFVCAIERIFS